MNVTEIRGKANTTAAVQSLNRYRLEIPSCPAAFDVKSFSGAEGLSYLYCYYITFTCDDKHLDASQLLCKPASLLIGTGLLHKPGSEKKVHGVVTDFKRISASADQTHYQITIEPFLALLGNQFRTHRFFVNKSVTEVVEQVLQEHGLKGWEFEFRLKNAWPKREQINQYQESDLAFIQRLLAEVGIFYFFTLHPDAQSEVVHFTDSLSGLLPDKKLAVNSPDGLDAGGADAVWGIHVIHNVVAASVTTNDYNHRTAQNLLQSAPADVTRGDGEGISYGEVYHYRQRHGERGEKIAPAPETANFWARLDHERILSGQLQISAMSSDATLLPGQVLTITDSTPPTLPAPLEDPVLLTGVRFSASRGDTLLVDLTAIPYRETRCWRPPLLPRPSVTGTMTARITSGKEDDPCAWLDACGLYRVQFDADRDAKGAGQESMPVRLAKPYGGDTYGFHFPLVQGTEVAIAFHEGDPDRPYIAHALHDSRHPDHVTELNHTRNVIRTPKNNKLRMEDKAEQEHIKLSTEYGGKTQLNLGHNVNAKRELRGEGAELRTDKWIAVRGGAGVFITADMQAAASGDVLEMQAAMSQLRQALNLSEALSSAAETAKAELADLQTQKSLLEDTLNELKQSALLLSAPAGIAASTPRSVQLAAGENIVATSGAQMDISVLKKFTLAAGEFISLFAQKMGIKMFAAKGPIEIQAQADEMVLDALKDIRISSSEGKIIISAKQEILLVGSGGAYIRIGDGVVESGAPDKIVERAAVWQKFSGNSASQMIQTWDKADYEVTPQVAWPYKNSPVTGQKMSISGADGAEQNTVTSGSGKTEVQNSISVDGMRSYLTPEE